ncbi:MAG: hypothetical protein JXA09_08700 [Anaerolineae bacterium]|nr:hypothetical protein [Anaerolineae bacterium]
MKKLIPVLVIVMLTMTLLASAQYNYPWYTSYMIQNLSSTEQATVVVKYYDTSGTYVTGADQNLTIPAGGQQTVVQYTDDPTLAGVYSAVVSSDQPVAVVVNQQTAPPGQSGMNSTPPFSSYSGASEGAIQVTLPEVMYNWYSYYTEFYVQNVGTGTANVDVAYYPGLGGASGVTDSATIPEFTSKNFSQKSKSALGAPSGTFAGRFNGAAVVSSDQPVVVVVNEHNEAKRKLFTYNGFPSGSTELVAPSVLRGHYKWYTSISIANPDLVNPAEVQITYYADTVYSLPEALRGTVVTATFTIDPGKALTRYDGPGGSPTTDPALTDLADFTRFFGTARIESDRPIVAKVNQENDGGNAEAYNCVDASTATSKVVVPLIQADFYKFYTSLTVLNLSDSDGTLTITYTSDGTYSSPTNTSITKIHPIAANGVFNSWEGGLATTGDVHNDGTFVRFNGAAVITSDVPIVAIVNEEKSGSGLDYGYSFNTVNTAP